MRTVPVADFEQSMAYLAELTDFERMRQPVRATTKLGLDRIRWLLDAVGNPQDRLPAVHIAGTKGKGSTAVMLSAMLEAHGLKTGLFLSPHVVSFRERIGINRGWISEADWTHWVNVLHPHLERSRPQGDLYRPTLFETLTVMALLHFVRQAVDVAILETGLGGRLDSTNVCHPTACGITGIGFDHMDKLGDTLPQIAWEKAGILKGQAPVVSAPQPPEALEVIRRRAAEESSTLHVVGEDVTLVPERPAPEEAFAIRTWRREYPDLRLAMRGSHQLRNAAVAVGLLECLAEAGRLEPSPEAVREGLQAARCPGRIEVVGEKPTVIIDGAHNVASIQALVETLEQAFPQRRIVVFSVAQDKDLDGVLDVLLPATAELIATRMKNPRVVEPETIAEKVAGRVPVTIEPDLDAALKLARQKAAGTDLICVTGSFYLAGQVRERLLAVEV